MKNIFKTIFKSASFFIIWALLVGTPIPNNLPSSIWRFFAELLPLVFLIGLSIIYMKYVDREIYDLKIKDTNVKNYMLSFLIGNLWIFSVIVVLKTLKVLNIVEYNRTNIIIWSISLLLNTIMQELLVRGYLYQMLKKKYNIIVAVIVSTSLFTFMHGGAFEAEIIAVLNVVLMSLFMNLLLEYYNSIIVPIIVHFIWNLVSAIIFGLSSLPYDYPHILTSNIIGNPIISGGAFKLEGSIIVTIINLFFVLVYIALISRKIVLSNKP